MNVTQKEIDVVSELNGLVPLFDTDLEAVAGGGVPEGLGDKTGFGGSG